MILPKSWPIMSSSGLLWPNHCDQWLTTGGPNVYSPPLRSRCASLSMHRRHCFRAATRSQYFMGQEFTDGDCTLRPALIASRSRTRNCNPFCFPQPPGELSLQASRHSENHSAKIASSRRTRYLLARLANDTDPCNMPHRCQAVPKTPLQTPPLSGCSH